MRRLVSVRFIDVQVRGPYRWWVHEHEFIDDGGRTIMRDVVAYGVPGGAVVDALLVRRRLLKIFRFRRHALERRFGAGRPRGGAADRPRHFQR